MDETTDTRHTVRESADKITLKTKVKRGTGTRDQDEVIVKVRGDDPAEAAEQLGRVLDRLADENITEALRETQPDEVGDD